MNSFGVFVICVGSLWLVRSWLVSRRNGYSLFKDFTDALTVDWWLLRLKEMNEGPSFIWPVGLIIFGVLFLVLS